MSANEIIFTLLLKIIIPSFDLLQILPCSVLKKSGNNRKTTKLLSDALFVRKVHS